MRLNLQMELCLSQKGHLYNVIPLDIKRKADRYLYEILNTQSDSLANKKIKTVQDYYDQRIKPNGNSKAS
jgi:hypothetical protein